MENEDLLSSLHLAALVLDQDDQEGNIIGL